MLKKNQKIRFLKTFSTMLAMMLAITCFSICVSADLASPFAISGEGSATGLSETFTIYSRSNSWFGHMTITVSSESSATIQVWDPNGKNLTPGGGAGAVSVPAGKTFNINITNAPSGTYTVHFASNNGVPITVSAILGDWYA